MRLHFFLGCFFGCAAALMLHASAAGYTDDMTSAADGDFKSYHNLAEVSFRGASALPDSTALSFADTSRTVGSAVYTVSGVETVKVAIYTQSGTLVSQRPEDGKYMLGAFQRDMSKVLAGLPLQALYCPQTGGIYTEAGGLKQAATDRLSYPFGPVISPPQCERIGYGVNIYYSSDGGQFTRVPITGVNFSYDLDNQIFYEVYSAAVPSSAKRIMAEINDVPELPLAGGGSQKKERRQLTAVASVTLSGGGMSMGAPVAPVTPVAPATPDSGGAAAGGGTGSGGAGTAEQYASQKSSGSSAGGEKGAAAEYVDGAKTETPSKNGSSSKFSGTITSSSKERSSKSSRQQSASAADSGENGEISASQDGESDDRGESIIYEISRKPEDSRFNGAITAYIIVVSGAILLVAVLPRKK